MAHYAYNHCKFFTDPKELIEIKEYIEEWEGDINIEMGDYLYVGFPSKYIVDIETIDELTNRFPNSMMEVTVTNNEGREELYVAQWGVVIPIEFDQMIKDRLEKVLEFIYYKEKCNEPTIKRIIEMLKDQNLSWFDATLRYLYNYPFKRLYKPSSNETEESEAETEQS